MNNISSFESDEDAEQKIRSIVLAHLYLKKREREEKVSLQELEDRVSEMDQAYTKVDLVKLMNNSNLITITDGNEFSITEEGMAEEEKRIQEDRIID
jgi:KaiC/GvpD/RAD55 family RecA-like ATPase